MQGVSPSLQALWAGWEGTFPTDGRSAAAHVLFAEPALVTLPLA